jgi:hypothetical protein
MGWSIGFDSNWKRDIGYGVPAICDFPGCGTVIDRGLGYVCGGEPYGGEDGCGLYFCGEHLMFSFGEPNRQLCERCLTGKPPFEPTPDTAEWLNWKLTDESWAEWRRVNPAEVERERAALRPSPDEPAGNRQGHQGTANEAMEQHEKNLS